jgi:hypothetical protein
MRKQEITELREKLDLAEKNKTKVLIIKIYR